jgi:hypothetical protein
MQNFVLPSSEQLASLSELEVRNLVAKATEARDEARQELDLNYNRMSVSIEQEYYVEIKSIMQLIVIKKESFPRGGTLDDTSRTIEIRKEIQDLYIKKSVAAVNAQIRRNDLRYNYAKQKNGIQRKWENEVGILKVYLKKFSTTNDAC